MCKFRDEMGLCNVGCVERLARIVGSCIGVGVGSWCGGAGDCWWEIIVGRSLLLELVVGQELLMVALLLVGLLVVVGVGLMGL